MHVQPVLLGSIAARTPRPSEGIRRGGLNSPACLRFP
jgi:hypothetical protein